MSNKPDYIDDDAWTMICGYLAPIWTNKTMKMAAGLIEMLDKHGYKIVKK